MVLFRILLVDDDKNILRMLQVFFEAAGISVFCVYRGKDAVKAFKESPFDMVITDLNMPEMDGLETAKNIRLLNHEVPIIMMTGSSDLPKNMMDYGISQIFVKPFSFKGMLSAAIYEMEKRKNKNTPRREWDGGHHTRFVLHQAAQ